MAENCPQDAIDRKTGFIERLIDKALIAVNKDLKGFFIVILVITNLVIFWKYTESLEARLSDNKDNSEQRIQEIKRLLMPEIDRRMDNKVEKIGKKVDSAAVGVNKLQKTLTEAINVLQ